MGSPISGLFANLVLEELDVECLSKLKQEYNGEPKCYFRYGVDTFPCIKNHEFDNFFKVFDE